MKSGDVVKFKNSRGYQYRILDGDSDSKKVRIECLGTHLITSALKHDLEIDSEATQKAHADDYSRRLDAGDPELTVQVEMAGQRPEFEEQSFQRFFVRHIALVDCEATRTLLRDYFHGDIVTLDGLELALEKLRGSLPTRRL